MVCVSEPENVAHMFENDVLEPTSGSDERYSAFAGITDHIQHRAGTAIRTCGRDQVPGRALDVMLATTDLVRCYPLEIGSEVT